MRVCEIDGCEIVLSDKNKKNICNKHLRPCSVNGCPNIATTIRGKCIAHGGKDTRKRCKYKDCGRRVVPYQDVCGTHGGKHTYKKCSEKDCNKNSHDKTGKCYIHSDKIYQVKCMYPGCDALCRKNIKYCLKHRTDLSMENYIKILIRNMRGYDKKDGYDINKLASIDELIQIYNNQNKKCYWCNRIVSSINDELLKKISIDRINNNIGHEKNNIVIACIFCNLAKNNSQSTDFKKYLNCLKTNSLVDFSDEDKFTGWASQLINGIKRTYKNHLKKLNLSESDNICITLDWIKKQFIKQEGLSYYTKIPMFSSTKAYYPFQCSVDRIDNNKTYTEDNCVLVCLSENYGRNTLDINKYLLVIDDIRKTE